MGGGDTREPDRDMTSGVLTTRTLNRATLARPPFLGLWSRLQGFRPEHLMRPVNERKIVRATLMRGTLHLVSTKDYQALRPVLQPMLSAGMQEAH
jgi:hypothetical protein